VKRIQIIKTIGLFFFATFIASAQTNELRVVGGKIYDVNNSPEWINLTIPAQSALRNAERYIDDRYVSGDVKLVSFNGVIQPQVVLFQIPAVYDFGQPNIATIKDFPYTPSFFMQGSMQFGFKSQNVSAIFFDASMGHNSFGNTSTPNIIPALVTKKAIRLRVFPLSHPITNWNASGQATIIPAKPIFDYGIPTNAPTK
jgi:hypothetical protein